MSDLDKLKRAWANSVGDDPDALDDWPVEQIVSLMDIIEAFLCAEPCRFSTEENAICGECEACENIEVIRNTAFLQVNYLRSESG